MRIDFILITPSLQTELFPVKIPMGKTEDGFFLQNFYFQKPIHFTLN